MKLQEAKEKAEEANKVKNTFLTNMTHELRTPLNSIIGMAEVCLENTGESEISEYLHLIHKSGRSLLSLINSILDYTNIEAGKFGSHVTGFRVDELIVEVAKQYADAVNDKGISLVATMKQGCPLRVEGDRSHASSVLRSVLENAVKFTEYGKIDFTVRGAVNRGGGREEYIRLYFSIRDTGIGMPKQLCDSIFKPFTQVDSSYTREYGGAGLGLTIAERIVRHIGGRIKVDSEKGSGTEFTIELPFRTHGENGHVELLDEDRLLFMNTRSNVSGSSTKGTIEEECSLSQLVTHFRQLVHEQKYNELEHEASRQKAHFHYSDKKVGDLLFKLILAARRSDPGKLEYILNDIASLCKQ
jgi:two-component system sensor histidine kinase/response regulator